MSMEDIRWIAICIQLSAQNQDAFLLAQQVTGKAALQVLQLQERGASVQHLCGKHAHAQTARDVGLA